MGLEEQEEQEEREEQEEEQEEELLGLVEMEAVEEEGRRWARGRRFALRYRR